MVKKKAPGGKKGKVNEVKQVEQEETEYDNMDLEMLQEVVPMLKQQLAKCTLDRNYVQLERDTIQTFYDITKKEVVDIEERIACKDREMESMEENHRVEVRVYMQKVKHLEYEQKSNIKSAEEDGERLQSEEDDGHTTRVNELEKNKKALQLELTEREFSSAEEIKQLKQQHAKNLVKMRQGMENQLEDLRTHSSERLRQIEAELELRRKVHVHEIEERKNLHINDLIKNHQKAFGQMKSYYNDITADNLKLIKSLKNEVSQMKEKAIANQQLMQNISIENQRLKQPLAVAVAQVAELRAQLRDRQKDRASLRNSKARLLLFEQQFNDLSTAHENLKSKYTQMEEERDHIYGTFELSISQLQTKSDNDNLRLEQQLEAMNTSADTAKSQLDQVVAAAGLDEHEIHNVSNKLQKDLSNQNAAIRDARFELLRMTKCYNDALRSYSQKLQDLGIPQPEIDSLGFNFIPTDTTEAPAGLVVR